MRLRLRAEKGWKEEEGDSQLPYHLLYLPSRTDGEHSLRLRNNDRTRPLQLVRSTPASGR